MIRWESKSIVIVGGTTESQTPGVKGQESQFIEKS